MAENNRPSDKVDIRSVYHENTTQTSTRFVIYGFHSKKAASKAKKERALPERGEGDLIHQEFARVNHGFQFRKLLPPGRLAGYKWIGAAIEVPSYNGKEWVWDIKKNSEKLAEMQRRTYHDLANRLTSQLIEHAEPTDSFGYYFGEIHEKLLRVDSILLELKKTNLAKAVEKLEENVRTILRVNNTGNYEELSGYLHVRHFNEPLQKLIEYLERTPEGES